MGTEVNMVRIKKKTVVKSYVIDSSDFPDFSYFMDKPVEVTEQVYKELKRLRDEGILAVVTHKWIITYGRNGCVYVAADLARGYMGVRDDSADNIAKVLARACRFESDLYEAAVHGAFGLEVFHLYEAACHGELSCVRNYRFEMKCVPGETGVGELRTIAATSREAACEIYWAWSRFSRERMKGGFCVGREGSLYRLSVKKVGGPRRWRADRERRLGR